MEMLTSAGASTGSPGGALPRFSCSDVGSAAPLLPDPREVPTLSVPEAARLLGVGRTAAYAAAREFERSDGRSGLPAVRVGTRFRVPTAALLRLLGFGQADVEVALRPGTSPER